MLTDVGDRSVGEVDNETMIVKFGKKYGLLNRDGGFGLEGFRHRTEDDFKVALRSDPDMFAKLYDMVVKEAIR
jgi:hypothetical protein